MTTGRSPQPTLSVEPRDAASLVIVEGSGAGAQVLLGQRRLTQAFAPGKFVFPGGSLDAADSDLAADHRLPSHDRIALEYDLGPNSGHLAPESFALAAVRETFEETGLVIGAPGSPAPPVVPVGWQPFLALGVRPNLAALSFIARAITPPGRSRRFDARFFLADAAAITHRTPDNDGEFAEISWFSFEAAMALDLHGMTRQILEEAQRFLALAGQQRQLAPVPYFREEAEGWRRRLIARGSAAREA